MIVLVDADLERAANAAVYYSMQNGGQTCISVERVYVEEPVYDEFVAKVTEKARALRQGVPERAGRGRRRRDHLAAADRHHRGPRQATPSDKGAKIVVGGHGRAARAARSSSRPSWSTSTTR